MKKELRECLPWMVAAAAVLLVFGTLELWTKADPAAVGYRYRSFPPLSEVDSYELIGYPYDDIGPIVFLSAMGLALALGVRQFWTDQYTRMWGFLLHRSTGRNVILAAKISSGLVAMTVAVGFVWTYLFWYAGRDGFLPVPPPARHLIEGWLLVAEGFVVYLGTALAGLSKARWYTTKLVGIAFALWVVVTIAGLWKLAWVIAVIAISVAILLCWIVETFLKREF